MPCFAQARLRRVGQPQSFLIERLQATETELVALQRRFDSATQARARGSMLAVLCYAMRARGRCDTTRATHW